MNLSCDILKLAIVLNKNTMPFYIEKNDFMNGGISIHEEIGEMLAKLEIDVDEAKECFELNSVWSARYYLHAGIYRIAYAATLEKVINKILSIMENDDEISTD